MIYKCHFSVIRKIFLIIYQRSEIRENEFRSNTTHNSKLITHEIMYFKVHLSKDLFKLFLFKNCKNLTCQIQCEV